MSWFSNLFNISKKSQQGGNPEAATTSAPAVSNPFAPLTGIRFGRYSDNNKSYEKAQQWYRAEELFKEKKYNESFQALFNYITDNVEDNVHFSQQGDTFTFDLIQGSKKITGSCDGKTITAKVPLAVMEQPVIATMRRLLDMNFILYYSRNALDEANVLCMLFETDIATATPDKLYNGLREMATKADKQDDLLLADFGTLQIAGKEYMQPLDAHELDVKYKYFKQWIEATLKKADEVNQDAFSGAIAYVLLGLIYRIDFLIVPDGKLLRELERINAIYWEKKEELTLVERNLEMKVALRKLLDYSKETFAESVHRTKATFAVTNPPKQDKVKDHIFNSNRDAKWYIDNKYPEIALLLNEYGVLYNEFVFNMPRVQRDLSIIYMAVMHSHFFSELGMKQQLYNPADKSFNKDAIAAAATEAVNRYKDKYTHIGWDSGRTSYNSLYEFGISFSEQIANLNLETKR